MAIDLYSGTPGSGKSLHLAREIYDYCRMPKERLVIANFSVDKTQLKHPERFVYMDNEDLTPERLIQIGKDRFDPSLSYSERENSIILMIDECQILFNARSWNAKDRSAWVKFFTQHRKLGYSVILVAQFDLMIDKQIRALIESQYVHRKLSSMGFFGLALKYICRGDLYVAVEIFYALRLKTGQRFFRARKKYYSLYDTSNLFEEFDYNGKTSNKEVS